MPPPDEKKGSGGRRTCPAIARSLLEAWSSAPPHLGPDGLRGARACFAASLASACWMLVERPAGPGGAGRGQRARAAGRAGGRVGVLVEAQGPGSPAVPGPGRGSASSSVQWPDDPGATRNCRNQMVVQAFSELYYAPAACWALGGQRTEVPAPTERLLQSGSSEQSRPGQSRRAMAFSKP